MTGSESIISVALLALLIGGVAGLRTFTAPAAVSWAARLGRLRFGGTSLAFMGSAPAVWILSALALWEFVFDQLPSTGSRTRPAQFLGRVVSGGLSGAAIGVVGGGAAVGLAAGIVGVVVGTIAGHAVRARLATALRSDHFAGLLEDALALCGALVIVLG